MILITGASGQVGIHLLHALSKRGIATRAWIHNDDNKKKILAAGAKEVFIGDLASRSDSVQAMQGVDMIYYICNTANVHEDKIGMQLIEVAKEFGNITFIYHSVLHSLLTDMPHHKRKLAVEKYLIDSGLQYVIIQPAVFMQMLAPAIQSVKKGGPFVQKFYTSEKTKMSFVDLNDYAEAAANIVTTGAFTYGTYEFCGEGTYSLSDIETIFSELIGHKVTSQYIYDADFLSILHLDPDSYAAQTLMTMFHHYNTNGFKGDSFTLKQILGHKPASLRDYLERKL